MVMCRYVIYITSMKSIFSAIQVKGNSSSKKEKSGILLYVTGVTIQSSRFKSDFDSES